jgi:hypothetical protein
MFHVPEQYRLRTGSLASTPAYGNNGAFTIPPLVGNRELWVIASDGDGWEHVSIHVWEGNKKYRLPTWPEMCHVKDMFWDDEDEVMQVHPKKSEYVNCHPYVLHLWKPIGQEILMPPPELVGPRES